jgi:hypothetical protein
LGCGEYEDNLGKPDHGINNRKASTFLDETGQLGVPLERPRKMERMKLHTR